MLTKKREKRMEILDLLVQDARLSNREIAERLMISEDEVQQVVEEAIADGDVLGARLLLHPRTRPDIVRAMIEVKARPERDVGFDHIARKLARFPEVIDVTLVSGVYDFILTVEGENVQEVAEFVSTKLAPIDGIESHATHFVLKRYKEAGIIMEKEETHERLNITP
ncbi:MAG: Lrp/AsnC family transcriptional regulator [Lentisphaerae bacterium]|nr:MAG: Lrp/AsnC family transcriptional regulator [Lentisphaerota bacterium]